MAAALSAASLLAWIVVATPLSIPKEPRLAAVAQTSRVFAADGSLLTSIHGEINRQPVPLAEMSRTLWQAAVAAEDARFFRHGGTDVKALVRAATADAAASAPVQGGSTITQQYVKAAYVGRDRTIVRKVREALLARKLERRLSKKEILERYLNTVYFGRGAYGVQAGANAYFGKPASRLTLSESAMLVGLVPAPAMFSPDRNPAAAEQRRVWVIDRMEATRFIDAATARQAVRDRPQVVALHADDVRFPWFTDAVERYLFSRYGVERVLTGGLQVRTTLDPATQKAAETVVRRALPNPQDPHAALAAVDPQTGYVRALVGGRDWGHERFNIATLGRRQPGSAFKPFVLAAALEKGMSPGATYPGPSSLCLRAWSPGCVSNFGHEWFGRISLEEATVHSVNTVYAQLILDVGPKRVVDVARRMGIPGPKWLLPEMTSCRPRGTPACTTLLRPKPALALGSQEVTPLELASAYATLAAGGVYRQPKVVEEVVDRSGAVLERGQSPAQHAISEQVAAETTQILHEVLTRGTGRRADIGPGAAGKTGTAQDFRNAWFAGYTPALASAVWVGYRDSNHPLLNVDGVRQVTGGTIPASIWADSMRAEDVAVSEPDQPGPQLLGQQGSYRLELGNLGPSEAGDVTLIDRLPDQVSAVSATPSMGTCGVEKGSVTCRVGALARGQRAVVDVVVRGKEAGTFMHTATVSSGPRDADPDNNTITAPIVVAPAAELSVAADAAGHALVGQELRYTLRLHNAGPSNASRAALSTLPPPGARFVSATPSQGTCERRGPEVACSLGDVPVGDGATATITIVPTQPGPFSAVVRGSAAEADPHTDNNRVWSLVNVQPAAHLRLEGRLLQNPVVVEQPLVYMLRVDNAGPSNATGVSTRVRLADGMLLRSAVPTQGHCRSSLEGVECALGQVGNGASAAIRVTVVPKTPGDDHLSADVHGNEADPNPGEGAGQATATVVPSADLSVGVRGPREVFVGDEPAYEVRVVNNGPSEASRVEVTAEIPPELGFATSRPDPGGCTWLDGRVHCLVGTLAPRSSATVTLLLRSHTAGRVSVGVTARAAEPDPHKRDNEATTLSTVLEGSTGSPHTLASGRRPPGWPRPRGKPP